MGCLYDLSLGQEACAVHKGFRAFGALGLEGLMITVDGRIIAYTFGEPFLQNTYLVHVEKAFPEYRGAYQVINQAFVKHILENIRIRYSSTGKMMWETRDCVRQR